MVVKLLCYRLSFQSPGRAADIFILFINVGVCMC